VTNTSDAEAALRLLRPVRAVLEEKYNGNVSRLARATSLSQPTVSRILDTEGDYTASTRLKNLKIILADLQDAGILGPPLPSPTPPPPRHVPGWTGRMDAARERLGLPTTEAPARPPALPVMQVAVVADAATGALRAEMTAVEDFFVDDSLRAQMDDAAGEPFVVHAFDDAMVPDIPSGAPVFVEPVARSAEAPMQLPADGVYLLRIERVVTIRRLQARPRSRVYVASANDAYAPYTLTPDTDAELLGRVWGLFRRF
jgi:hypothetical protein